MHCCFTTAVFVQKLDEFPRDKMPGCIYASLFPPVSALDPLWSLRDANLRCPAMCLPVARSHPRALGRGAGQMGTGGPLAVPLPVAVVHYSL